MFSLSLTNYLQCCLFCESLNLHLISVTLSCSRCTCLWFSRGVCSVILIRPNGGDDVYTCTSKWARWPSMYSVNEFESMLSIFLSPSSSFCRCPGAGGCFAGLFGLWPYLISVNSPSVQLKSLSEFSSYGHHVIFNFDL